MKNTICFFTLTLFVLAVSACSKKQKALKTTQHQAESDYALQFAQVPSQPRVPNLRPVHIGSEKLFIGSGTLVLDSAGKPYRIITAAHLFWKGYGKKTYEYVVIEKTGHGARGYISSVNCNLIRNPETPSLDADIAICELGEATPAGGNSEIFYKWGDDNEKTFRVSRYLEPVSVIPIFSEGTARVVGKLKEDGGQIYFALDYQSFPGLSGAGFYEPKEGILYVIGGGGILNPEMRKALRLPEDLKIVTTSTPVGVR